MARTLGVSEFRINHRIKFRSLIRGHHVYKNIWNPCKGEKLAVCPDDRGALEFGKCRICIYKEKDDDCNELVSSLLYHFVQANDDSYVKVEILGKRKHEAGLVVPAKYNDFTAKRQIAKILDAELWTLLP